MGKSSAHPANSFPRISLAPGPRISCPCFCRTARTGRPERTFEVPGVGCLRNRLACRHSLPLPSGGFTFSVSEPSARPRPGVASCCSSFDRISFMAAMPMRRLLHVPLPNLFRAAHLYERVFPLTNSDVMENEAIADPGPRIGMLLKRKPLLFLCLFFFLSLAISFLVGLSASCARTLQFFLIAHVAEFVLGDFLERDLMAASMFDRCGRWGPGRHVRRR